MTPESAQILSTLAQCYRLNAPVLFEGPTATGKTYLIEKFTELLYGKGRKPLDFYCSGQTDVSELMGKWVPASKTVREQERWDSFLRSTEGQKHLEDILATSQTANALSDEQRRQRVLSDLHEIAREAGLSGSTQWEFQYGAVPLAMQAQMDEHGNFHMHAKDAEGFILHVEEVGLAKPVVVNALLKLRGEFGEVTDEIQLWENGGEHIQAGNKFWFAMSTNPPEEYLDRNEIDPALARGLVFVRLGEVSEDSYRIAARHYLRFDVGNLPKEVSPNSMLRLETSKELCDELALVIGTFHKEFVQLLSKGESGRQQRVPATFDDMARLSKYLQEFQSRPKALHHCHR